MNITSMISVKKDDLGKLRELYAALKELWSILVEVSRRFELAAYDPDIWSGFDEKFEKVISQAKTMIHNARVRTEKRIKK